MTKNQIDYQSHLERIRSNVENERLNQRRQRWQEHVDFHNMRETKRANLAKEAEINRANVENERLKAESNNILATHYQTQNAETKRANQAREQLTAESNEIQKQQVILGYHTADVQRQNVLAQVGLGYSQLAETQRSHQANEVEINRSNLANERIKRSGNISGYVSALANQTRANLEVRKWDDETSQAQRKADLQRTKVQTSDIVHNAADRRVKTVTGGVRDLAGSVFSVLKAAATSGRNYIN